MKKTIFFLTALITLMTIINTNQILADDTISSRKFSNNKYSITSYPLFQERENDGGNNSSINGYRSNKGSIPDFIYFDLELFGASISAQSGLASGFFIDWYNGMFILHAGLLGGYLSTDFFMLETGVSIVLSSSYRQRVPVKHMFLIGSDSRYQYYKVSGSLARALDLKLFDIGIKFLAPLYYQENNPDSDSIIFGKPFSNVDEVDYYVNDKILYFGYKFMALRSVALTINEAIWYIHGLIGFSSRKAGIWDNNSINKPTFTETENTKIRFGFETGLRYWITEIRMGFYDKYFYFNAGFRIGFQTGL
ncbi:MAG: hypothetical protein KAS64_03725 [Spirochaetes bacterium]|nr:hypothetical protein [Spirochaetota bacterium]